MLYEENVIDFAPGYENTLTPRAFREKIGKKKAEMVRHVAYGSKHVEEPVWPEYDSADVLQAFVSEHRLARAKLLRERAVNADRELIGHFKKGELGNSSDRMRSIVHHFTGVRTFAVELNVIRWGCVGTLAENFWDVDYRQLERFIWQSRFEAVTDALMIDVKERKLLRSIDGGPWVVVEETSIGPSF